MTITVGFQVFPGIQLLDLAGPYEIFSALPDCRIHLFWKNCEPVACSSLGCCHVMSQKVPLDPDGNLWISEHEQKLWHNGTTHDR